MTFSSSPSVLPSEELLDAWIDTVRTTVGYDKTGLRWLAKTAAQWGADQELKACCEWLDIPKNRSDRGDGWLMPGGLRAARRPKSLSLKEQALAIIRKAYMETLSKCQLDALLLAVKQLPDEQ